MAQPIWRSSSGVDRVGVMQKTAIIVPCYNEGKRLRGHEFIKCASAYKDLHFIFINDGSTDDTQEKLLTICKDNPMQLHCIALEKNSGKAEAVRKGFHGAFQSDFVNIGYWDADLATPLGVIPIFCEILDTPGVSMVIGSRVRLLGRKVERRAARHYLGRLFATFASLILGLPVYDTQCGAKIFRYRKELEIVFHKPFSVRWTFDVEILARFLMIERFTGTGSLKSSSVEFPLEEWIDIPGSKIKPTDFIVGVLELLKILIFFRAPGTERRFTELSTGLAQGHRTS